MKSVLKKERKLPKKTLYVVKRVMTKREHLEAFKIGEGNVLYGEMRLGRETTTTKKKKGRERREAKQ